jgi:hypothetical protein
MVEPLLKYALNAGQENLLESGLSYLATSDGLQGLGTALRGLAPQQYTRSGLPSGTVFVDGPVNTTASPVATIPEAGEIIGVTSEDGVTNLTVVYGTTAPAVGEVQVIYDNATGVPTLTFQAAVTGWRVVKKVVPDGWAAKLDASYPVPPAPI